MKAAWLAVMLWLLLDETNCSTTLPGYISIDEPPKADPGPDVTIKLPERFVTLNGSRSSDDKGITSYMWSKTSRDMSADMEGTRRPVLHLENLEAGNYVFSLTVTDTAGQTDTAHVYVYVKQADPMPCRTPNSISGGYWEFSLGSSLTTGTQIRYKCHIGFQLRGTRTLACLSNGQWSSRTPECIKMCPPPPKFLNAHTTHSVPELTAVYLCDEGYALLSHIPVAVLLCKNGNWNGTTPVCQKITPNIQGCRQPPKVPNAVMDPNIYKSDHDKRDFSQIPAQSQVTYRCHFGFKLEGDKTLVCTNGHWEPGPPSCVRDETNYCDVPTLDNHSTKLSILDLSGNIVKIDMIRVPEGYQANFTCTDPRLPRPRSYIVECKQGEWKGSTPTCSPVTCDDPPMIPYGNRIINYFPHEMIVGTTVQYTCKDGYKLIGSEVLTCNYDRKWTEEVPRCHATGSSCRPPEQIQNGRYFCTRGTCGDRFLPNTVISYVCHSGYDIDGHVVRTCLENGKWDREQPMCIQVLTHGTSLSPVEHGATGTNTRGIMPDVDLNTITIVVATSCSVLGMLVLIMIAVAFQRCQKTPRFCRPMDPPPPPFYPAPPPVPIDEHDRLALIAFADGMQVTLPTYEEAVQGQNPQTYPQQPVVPPGYNCGRLQYRPPPDYRPRTNQTSSLHVGRTDSVRSTPPIRDQAPDHHRNSIITTVSNMTRDNMSELLGSVDTMNVSDGTSTSVTVGTCDSSVSNPSIAMSHRGTAGSLLSSDCSLATNEDCPLLESSNKEESWTAMEAGLEDSMKDT